MTRSRRLLAAERVELIARYRDGALGTELAAAFGISSHTVSYHTQGVSRSAAGTARIRALRQQAARYARSFRRPRLSAADIHTLIGLWDGGMSAASLAERFSVSIATIRKVTRGRRRWQVAGVRRPARPLPPLVPLSPAEDIPVERPAARPAPQDSGQPPSDDAQYPARALGDRRSWAPIRRSRWIADLIGPLQQVDDGRRHELIAGVAHTRPLPDPQQTAIATRVAAALDTHVTVYRLGRVYHGVWCVLSRFPPTVLLSQVAYLRATRANTWYGALPLVPDLVVEVLAATERYSVVAERIALWLDAGTQRVVVVQPRTRSVGVHEAQGVTRIRGRQHLTGGDVVPDWRMPVGALFR